MSTVPSPAKYGKVVWRTLVAAADSVLDADDKPDAASPGGTVTFAATADYVTIQSANPPVTIYPGPVVCTIDSDGYLRDPANNIGVQLLATNDPSMTPTDFEYRVSITMPNGIKARSFLIKVPADTITDLTLASPIATQSGGVVIIKGDKGDPGAPGGAGAVLSVNSRTGAVVLTLDDIAETATGKKLTADERTKLAGLTSGGGSGGVLEDPTDPGFFLPGTAPTALGAYVTATPNTDVDAAASIQATIDAAAATVRASTTVVAQATVYVPAGRYRLNTGLVVPPYVRLVAVGLVIFETYIASGTAIWQAPQAADANPVFTGAIKEQDAQGVITGGALGFIFLRNMAGTAAAAVGWEFGTRADSGKKMARYTVENIGATGYNTGLQLNSFNHYIGRYYNYHAEGNVVQVNYGVSGVDPVNSGENFQFYGAVLAGAGVANTRGLAVRTFGFDASFVSSSFDFLRTAVLVERGYGSTRFIGGHFEAINDLASATDAVVNMAGSTANEPHKATFSNVSMLVHQHKPWFITAQPGNLHVSGEIMVRSYASDVNLPYPDAVPVAGFSVIAAGLRNIAARDRRILDIVGTNRISDPFFNTLAAATGAIATTATTGTLGRWTVSKSNGVAVDVLDTDVDTPITGGKSVRLTIPVGSFITFEYADMIPLRNLDELYGFLVVKINLANPNIAVGSKVYGADAATLIEQKADATLSSISALPVGSWQMPRFMGPAAVNFLSAAKASYVKPRFLISNPGGNASAMTVTVPLLYFGS